ncbi:MAG: hypothetical protein B6226_03980 [Candidatus Cloacimonetes bacterium 4572_65]|nr:MAG: hypothetical protein B6226_03980 [Candidatus Cloacimonetes bacterium 4572_65]
MKYLKRLVMFFSIFLLYIVFKEFVGFYLQMRALNIYLGYGVVGASSLFFIYFCLVPIYKILRIPCQYAPVFDKSKEQKLIENRIDNYRSNLFLKEQNFDMDVISPTKEDYAQLWLKMVF